MKAKRTGLLVILLATAATVVTMVIIMMTIVMHMKSVREEQAPADGSENDYWHAASAYKRSHWNTRGGLPPSPELEETIDPVASATTPDRQAGRPETENALTPVTAIETFDDRANSPAPNRRRGQGSPALAVVNMERIIASFPSASESDDARKQVVRRIQEQVREFATSRNLPLIFDISGMSINRVPIILSAKGVADVTDEILRELGPIPEN